MSKNVMEIVQDIHEQTGVPVDVIMGYGPGELDALVDRLRVEAELRRAVDTHELNVMQRISDLLVPITQEQGFEVLGQAMSWILANGTPEQKRELAWLALPKEGDIEAGEARLASKA